MESAAEPGAGQPRTARDGAAVDRFDAAMRIPIFIAAVLPLLIVPENGGWLAPLIDVVTWLVFVVDYVFHARRLQSYGRTWTGRFDLFVVVATAPWFLLPGAQAGRFVMLVRLARLARVLRATKGSRRLFSRIGRVVVIAGVIVVVGSLVAYSAEHATNPEFATVGDALWWGIVTLTTVGYGDIVPKTSTGRWAAVMIMITGIAVLGVLSGSLASYFRLGSNDQGSGEPGAEVDPDALGPSPDAGGSSPGEGSTPVADAVRDLSAQVAALRQEVVELTERVGSSGPSA